MSKSRPAIITILEKEFKDPVKKDKLCKSSLTSLEQDKTCKGMATRVFDDFPCLLPEEEINSLTEDFRKLLTSIKETSIAANEYRLTNSNDIENTMQWLAKLTTIAQKELLDENGRIEYDIIKLLGWHEQLYNLGKTPLTLNIIIGYVGLINQIVMKKLDKIINENKVVYTALALHCNSLARDCIIKELQKSGFDYGPSTMEWVLDRTTQFIKDYNTPGVRLFTGAVVFGVGYFIFKVPPETLLKIISPSSSNNDAKDKPAPVFKP